MKYNLDYVSPELRAIIEPAAKEPHRFQGELSYTEYTDSYIAPFVKWGESIGCALDSQGNAINCFLSDFWQNGKLYDLQAAETEHKTVIFLGFLLSVFGHAFTDNYRTLWFLDTDICKELLESGAELVYTTDHNKPLSDTYVHFFQMAGFDIRKARHIDRLIKFDKVIIPDSSIVTSKYGRLFNSAYCTILERVRAHVSSIVLNPVYDKIYFTRTKFPYKKESGEEKIEDYFRNAGYTIISPEHYPLETQFQMVRSCSSFATTEGSIAHISLFCSPGTKVIIINKANYLNEHQVMINELADLDVTYIQAHHSTLADPERLPWGPFFLYPTKYLRRFFGYKTPGLPYWLSKDYWSYYFGLNPKTRRLKNLYRSLLKIRS
jgi:capsular polysaccharide biosynthesis protein